MTKYTLRSSNNITNAYHGMFVANEDVEDLLDEVDADVDLNEDENIGEDSEAGDLVVKAKQLLQDALELIDPDASEEDEESEFGESDLDEGIDDANEGEDFDLDDDGDNDEPSEFDDDIDTAELDDDIDGDSEEDDSEFEGTGDKLDSIIDLLTRLVEGDTEDDDIEDDDIEDVIDDDTEDDDIKDDVDGDTEEEEEEKEDAIVEEAKAVLAKVKKLMSKRK